MAGSLHPRVDPHAKPAPHFNEKSLLSLHRLSSQLTERFGTFTQRRAGPFFGEANLSVRVVHEPISEWLRDVGEISVQRLASLAGLKRHSFECRSAGPRE